MEPISSLFKVEPISKANSERASVIEWFVNSMRDKKGNKYKPSYIAFKVSHLNLQELYYMKSTAIAYQHNGGEVGRYFFGSLKNR